MKKKKKNQETQHQGVGSGEDVIFLCGWCGLPVAEDGSLLPEIKDAEAAHEYLEVNSGRPTKSVNGACHPDGFLELEI